MYGKSPYLHLAQILSAYNTQLNCYPNYTLPNQSLAYLISMENYPIGEKENIIRHYLMNFSQI